MKVGIALLILIGITYIVLVLRSRKDDDAVLEKSEKRSVGKVMRNAREMKLLSERIYIHDREGRTDTKDHKRMEVLNGRLDVMNGNPLRSIEQSNRMSSSGSAPLKRF